MTNVHSMIFILEKSSSKIGQSPENSLTRFAHKKLGRCGAWGVSANFCKLSR